MTNIEKGRQIKNCVEAIEKLKKADNMLNDKGYHAPSISIRIHHRNQVGTMEEVVLDGEYMRDIIHKGIKAMYDINNETLNKLLESKE